LEGKMFQDLRYGAWILMKNPGFTAVALLSLALAIGVNTATFSLVDAVFLKPLSYQDPERLVMVWELSQSGKLSLPSPVTFLKWRAQTQVFSHLSAITSPDNLSLNGVDRTERISGSLVSANYFEMLGERPMIGRTFRMEEEQPGNDHVVVLTNRFWQQRFGADPNVLGTTILLNSESYVVIGVLPSSTILDQERADLWLPLAFKPEQLRPNVQFFSVLGRLKHGVTLEQGNAEVRRIAELVSHEMRTDNASIGAIIQPLRDHIIPSDTKTILSLLTGAAFLVLLISCANVANLLLARGTVRQGEVAIRIALGASRLRLIRQFLTEGMLLAMISGGLGVVLAIWLIKGFIRFMPRLTVPTEVNVSLDWRALLFTLGFSFSTGILFGLIPAWLTTHLNLTKSLQKSIHGAPVRLNRNKPHSLLLILEIAISFVLTIGAFLMVRSLVQVIQVELGFDTKNIITLRTDLDRVHYPQSHQIIAYQTELLERIRALPGVVSASVTNVLPLGRTSIKNTIQLPSVGPIEPGARISVAVRSVGFDYFNTMGIRLLKGRFPSEQDIEQSLPVIVINQSLANQFGSDKNLIGTQVQTLGATFTIVGVVADTKHRGPDGKSESEIYVTFVQLPEKALSSSGRSLFFMARTTVDPASFTTTIQTLAANIDKNQPIYGIRTMEQLYSESITQRQFWTILFGLFGILALVMAAVGIYGLMAYSVKQRTHEIGIRMALGAQPNNVLRLVLGQALLLAIISLGIGMATALALSRHLSALLYDVKPTDAATYFGVALLFVSIAVIASYVPARRAMKVDPMTALRCE
jgi:putative ABC transport system permease protein